MRLVKKIKFKRAKELSQFKKIESIFLENKNSGSVNSTLSVINDISELHFYMIVDYVNLVNERVNYEKIFHKDSVVNYNVLIEEQEKLKDYINKKKPKGPEYFKRLGILNEVSNCYMVACTKKNVNVIKGMDLNNKEHILCVKFNVNYLPKEFEHICNEFAKSKYDLTERDHKDFEKFINLSTDEQDNIIQDMLYNIQFNPINRFNNSDNTWDEVNNKSSGNTMYIAAENSLDKIWNITFLESMMDVAEENESYELCAKIRDRINNLR